MRLGFYLSRIVFAAGWGFNTDFHGWGCEIYDGFPRICIGGGVAHRFCGFLCGGGGTRVFTEFVVFTHFCVDLCYYVLSVFIIVLAVVWNFWRNCGNFLLLQV